MQLYKYINIKSLSEHHSTHLQSSYLLSECVGAWGHNEPTMDTFAQARRPAPENACVQYVPGCSCLRTARSDWLLHYVCLGSVRYTRGECGHRHHPHPAHTSTRALPRAVVISSSGAFVYRAHPSRVLDCCNVPVAGSLDLVKYAGTRVS
jgi:hypothetical protein